MSALGWPIIFNGVRVSVAPPESEVGLNDKATVSPAALEVLPVFVKI